MTKMLNNIEESYYHTLRTLLDDNGYSGVKLLNAFPDIESPDFSLPSISIELLVVPAKTSADLGVKNQKSVSIVIDIFATDFFQRNDLADLIKNSQEDKSLSIKNYLADGNPHITYGRYRDILVKTLRGEDKEKFRTNITFDIEFLEDI